MKIALVAPFEEPVPPRTYGGTELVVYNLAEELVIAGHDVTVFASGDSRTSARLWPVFPVNLRQHPDARDTQFREALKFIGIGRVIEGLAAQDFDIIHNHLGWRLMPFAACLPAPIVTTLHGPLNIAYHAYLYTHFGQFSYVSISDAQRRPAPGLNFAATVYNGIDCSQFEFNDSPQDYFVFLGRFSPEKNPVEAISAAKRAGVRLRMAAKIDTVDRRYFEEHVAPLIDGTQVEYVGEVGHAEKNELLRNARGLLFPIDWEEPFGLVMIEALATGTPVIAYPRGSVPEIVRDGAGFITRNVDEMVNAILNIGRINRRACREYAVEHFDRSVMARRYVAAYERIAEVRPSGIGLSDLGLSAAQTH